jgi:hypothetical protein
MAGLARLRYAPAVTLPAPSGNRPPRRALYQAGGIASALAIFLCGFLAMHMEDWRAMLGFTLLAAAAGAAASAFARRARG